MSVAQRNFPLSIILRGQTDGSFNKMANSLVELGTYIESIGGPIRDMEKEALNVYKQYETSMLEAKGALTTTTASTAELEKTYKQLEHYAQQWAASTIFHTDDVAKAIAEASHAGWTYSEMIEGIPSAMLLAQAGGMDLSEALDDLIKVINGSGIAFSDSQQLVDQWAFAANSSATTISEMGDAMTAMGQTMTFAGDTGELVTMLGILANNGTTGAKAGTLLRNAFIRLVAPTKNAASVMESLGATEEEIAEAMEEAGTSSEELSAFYEEIGLHAYDTEGNLRPMMDIFADLNTLTADMSEQERNDVLSKIFPLRSITGGLALLGAAQNGWEDFYSSVLGSSGYAQRVAEIQTSGMFGAEELTASKWEELERKIGEILSQPYEGLLTMIGSVLDTMNNMDPAILEALTGAVTAIGMAGPLMMGGAVLMKVITLLGAHPVAGIAIGAAATIGLIVGAIDALNKANYEELKRHFGELGLSTETLTNYVNSLGEATGAEGLYDNLNSLNAALADSAQQYEDARKTMSQGLLDSVTGMTLTDAQKNSLLQAGSDMANAVLDGIKASQEGSFSLLDALFGGEMSAENVADYEFMSAANNSLFSSQYAEAYQIGQELRTQMTAALADSTLDDGERDAIRATIARLDEIEAQIQGRMEKAEHYKKLQKSGTLGLEGFKEIASEIQAYTASREEAINDAVATEQAYLQMAWDEAAVNGDGTRTLSWYDANGDFVSQNFSQADFASAMAAVATRGSGEIAQLREEADAEMQKWLRELSIAAGYGDAFDLYQSAMANFGSDGGLALAKEGRRQGMTFGRWSTIAGQLDELRALAGTAGVAPEYISRYMGDGTYADTSDGAWSATLAVDVDEASVAEAETTRDSLSRPINVPIHTYYAERGFWARDRALSEYADGGRATRASIFGEAGAEWAIPEEHSSRTAELLNSARAASGFSWGELIARTGGLSGNPQNVSVPVTYAPTIYAGNASGLAEVLKQDKKELAKLMRDVLRDDRLMAAVSAY